MSKISKIVDIYQKEGGREMIRTMSRYSKNRYNNKIQRPVIRRLDEFITPHRGRYLFNHEWDLAIILDACRYDLGYKIGQEHQIKLDKPQKVYSVGSTSSGWIERTFNDASENTLSDTAYICANPHTNYLPQNKLKFLDEVFRYGWDPKLGTVPPRPVTDQTIKHMRNDTAKKYVVHYMQPHLPKIETSNEEKDQKYTEGTHSDFVQQSRSVWKLAKSGEDPEAVIQRYKSNLSPVLDDVQLLLDNVDTSNVVITADHGNYLGEKGRWGHPSGHIHPAVRYVPWWETKAVDKNTHTPNSYHKTKTTEREKQLKALGYI